MEMEENHHHHACKRSRVGNGSQLAAKISHKEQHQDEDEEDGEGKAGGGGGSNTRIMPWQHHPSSRIYRVSRASGGKDRHSKVVTSKGLRDRRVRLSVSTAIQFYDLQDRLGYDQPSKAIEWLIKAAAAAINELPSLDVFLKPPHIGEEDKAIVAEPEADPTYNQQLLSTKSGCSSTSETSKGSVLSLSRSESRVKARERARGRAAKDKEKDREEGSHMVTSSHQNLSPGLNSQTSFTELLTGGGGGSNGAAVTTIATVGANSNTTSIAKQISTADYFSQAGLFAQPQKTNRLPSGFSSPSPYGNSTAMGMVPFSIAAAAAATTGDHPEMQHMQQFSFLHDNLIPVSAVPATGDYNLNFSISSGLAGFNRGTLQSNSPSQLPHHHIHNHNNNMQRLSSVDGANLPFYFGASAVPAGTANNAETQFPAAFDGRLQLCYGDGFRRPDVKGERKS